MIEISASGTSHILLHGIIQRKLFLIRRRKLSERESRERNSVWKGRFTSTDRLVGEKEGSSPCGNSLPLFTVIRFHGRRRLSISFDGECTVAYEMPSSNQHSVICQEFLPFHFSVIRAKNATVFGVNNSNALVFCTYLRV